MLVCLLGNCKENCKVYIYNVLVLFLENCFTIIVIVIQSPCIGFTNLIKIQQHLIQTSVWQLFTINLLGLCFGNELS